MKHMCIMCALYELCVEWEGVTSECESCDNFEPIEYENEITEKTEDGGTPCILHKKEG